MGTEEWLGTQPGVAALEVSVGILRKQKAELPLIQLCHPWIYAERRLSAQRVPEIPDYYMLSAWVPISM